MAYSTTNPPSRIAGTVGGEASIWSYLDGDPIATVEAANYISDGDLLGMKVGDKVAFDDTTLNLGYFLRVTAVTSGGAATLGAKVALT